jgi:hypothetical protein
VFVKKLIGNVDWAQVTLGSGGFGTSQYVNINLSNGTIGNSSGGTARIEAYANGWYRVSWTCVATATVSTSLSVLVAGIQNTNGTTRTPSYAGSTANKFLAAMAQLEAGSFATSYIPTVASSVVRSADVCSITGANFTSFWNRFAGTVIIAAGSNNGGRWISNNSGARAVEISGSANIDFYEGGGGSSTRLFTGATYPNKVGLAYAINDYQGAYNGTLGGSDTNTNGTIPNSSELHIGNLGNVSDRFTGHLASIRYYKKRLPNAKLVTLTT